MVNRFTVLGLVAALSLFGLGLLVVALAGSGGTPPAVEAAATTPPSAAGPLPLEPTSTPTATSTAAPEPAKATPLERAAKAAGCVLRHPPNEGAEHVDQPTSIANYGSNPPTSGVHHPEWAPDGVYDAENTPGLEFTVHALEHGRINVQYAKGTPAETFEKLAEFHEDSDGGYHMLLFQNQTNMPFAVAATAWDHLIGCKTFNAKTIKALAEFRIAYIDQGPETVP